MESPSRKGAWADTRPPWGHSTLLKTKGRNVDTRLTPSNPEGKHHHASSEAGPGSSLFRTQAPLTAARPVLPSASDISKVNSTRALLLALSGSWLF